MARDGVGGIDASRSFKILGAVGVALLTANCSSQKLASSSGGRSLDPKYGVYASPKVIADGEPVPKGGGREMSGRPYVVAGKTYVPRGNAEGYARVGLASWYGTAFHGRLTANGEIFDKESIAAAHPTLPLPSYVRVTNLENSRSMILRVNDRGPYHANRVMDVSERAAEALEFHRSGTAKVKVEYVGKASVAGSDDRMLLATLRTDGRPASGPAGRNTIMLADLKPDGTPPTPRALAFRQEEPVAEPRAAVVQEPRVTNVPAPVSRSAEPIVVASAARDNLEEDEPETLAASPSRSSGSLSAKAPLPPERPFELGTTAGTGPARPSAARLPVAQLPPSRRLATNLFYAPAEPPRRTAKDDPFASMKPQKMVSLKSQP